MAHPLAQNARRVGQPLRSFIFSFPFIFFFYLLFPVLSCFVYFRAFYFPLLSISLSPISSGYFGLAADSVRSATMGAWSKFFCRGSRNCGLGRGASAVSEEFRGEEPSVGEAGGDQISRGFVFERCAV